MKESKFSGRDLILISDFLRRFVKEADTLGISEGQLIVSFHTCLTRPYQASIVKVQVATVSMELPMAGDLAVFISHVWNRHRDSGSNRGTGAHTGNKKISIFVKVLFHFTHLIVERFWREQPRYGLTFSRIVAFVHDEGDSPAHLNPKRMCDLRSLPAHSSDLVQMQPEPCARRIEALVSNVLFALWNRPICHEPRFITMTLMNQPWNFSTIPKPTKMKKKFQTIKSQRVIFTRTWISKNRRSLKYSSWSINESTMAL